MVLSWKTIPPFFSSDSVHKTQVKLKSQKVEFDHFKQALLRMEVKLQKFPSLNDTMSISMRFTIHNQLKIILLSFQMDTLTMRRSMTVRFNKWLRPRQKSILLILINIISIIQLYYSVHFHLIQFFAKIWVFIEV